MTIERKAISALKWAMAAKLVIQIASWAGTLVIVRLLTPDDYGLMAKAAVVCGIAAVIAEFGLEAAIVRSVEITRDELRKLYGVSLILGATMTAAIAAAAPFLARLFQDPRLTWPIAVASLQVVIGLAAIIPRALRTRHLSFRSLAKVEMFTGVAGIGATLVLALLGFGVWALVLGTLCGAISRSATLLIFGERVWPLFSLRGIGEHLKLGLTVVTNRVSYFVLNHSDVVIGSGFLSTAQIGQYSVGLQLATLPMTKIMGTINQITLSAMARQQEDRARVRQAVLKALGVLSLVAFPALWGISAVAPELVSVLLGERWLLSITPLMLLPLIVPIRMAFSVMFTTSLALGNRSLDLRNTIINFTFIPTGFFIGAHWGLVGLCLAWLVSVPLAYSLTTRALLRALGIRAIDLIVECGSPAAAAGVMYVAVVTMRFALVGQSAIVTLLALSATGAFAYLGSIALISRRHLVSGRNFARSLLARDANID